MHSETGYNESACVTTIRSEIGTPPDYLSSMFAFGATARNCCARPHLELVAQVQRVKHVRINVFAVGEHSPKQYTRHGR